MGSCVEKRQNWKDDEKPKDVVRTWYGLVDSIETVKETLETSRMYDSTNQPNSLHARKCPSCWASEIGSIRDPRRQRREVDKEVGARWLRREEGFEKRSDGVEIRELGIRSVLWTMKVTINLQPFKNWRCAGVDRVPTHRPNHWPWNTSIIIRNTAS